jgi:hypothetical protein
MSDWPTDFLFEEPSFASGAASVLDLMGVYPAYNRSKGNSEADEKALLNDWHNVGKDIAQAIPAHDKKK